MLFRSQLKNTAKVIVVTPSNRTASARIANEASLDWYRDSLTKHALLHGYSVIDGSKVGFADHECAYQLSTMSDGLHPTELGYKIYARHILGLIS